MSSFPSPDPVAAVLRAHEEGRPLALVTAGTTGAPRTIRRTTASWWSSFEAYADLSGVGPGARLWVPGPLDATMNLFAAVHAAVVGATVTDAPHRATHACLTPTALDRLGDLLPRGTRVVVAGAALSPRLHDRATAAGLVVASYYGAAELSFVAAGAHSEDLRPFPGVGVEILQDTIWVRSPYLAEGLGPWASVGDQGRLDGDRLVVLGRPGTATTAGATVSLAAIESTLQAHAAAPLAVVALPHDGLGEVVAVVLTGADLDAVRMAARDLLPETHRPRRWCVVPELPHTPAGKVDRPRIRTQLLDGVEA